MCESIVNSQQMYSWRDDDLELIIEKINSKASWSTRMSAFESMKEVMTDLHM